MAFSNFSGIWFYFFSVLSFHTFYAPCNRFFLTLSVKSFFRFQSQRLPSLLYLIYVEQDYVLYFTFCFFDSILLFFFLHSFHPSFLSSWHIALFLSSFFPCFFISFYTSYLDRARTNCLSKTLFIYCDHCSIVVLITVRIYEYMHNGEQRNVIICWAIILTYKSPLNLHMPDGTKSIVR